jgi:hypothetical protein
MRCYKRDYDLLGYKYALLSQLATAGLNNVLCMVPARDEAEFELFPKEVREEGNARRTGYRPERRGIRYDAFWPVSNVVMQ